MSYPTVRRSVNRPPAARARRLTEQEAGIGKDMHVVR